MADQTDDKNDDDFDANAAWRMQRYWNYITGQDSDQNDYWRWIQKFGRGRAIDCGTDSIQIVELQVAAEFRRRGIGTALVESVIELAPMFDLDTEVIVESDNKAAVQLFSDLDFTTGERINLV